MNRRKAKKNSVNQLPTSKVAGQAHAGKVNNEVTLDAKNPIPLDYGVFGSFSVTGNKYLPFLHPKDDFFNTLLEASLLSVTQKACIDTKTDYIVGEGVVPEDPKSASGKAFLEYAKHVNVRGENLNTVLRKAIEGYLKFGNQPVEFVRLEVAGKRYLFLYAKNTLDCRLSYPNDNDIVENVLVSRYFRRNDKTSYVYDEKHTAVIPLYNPKAHDKRKNWVKVGNTEHTCIWLCNPVAGYDHYGLPSSVASISYQKLEYDYVRYNMDMVDNQMVTSGAIFLNGSLATGEGDKIATNILKRHTGKGKLGRVAVFTTEGGIDDVKWVPFNTEKEGSYVEIDNKVESKILSANQWDAVLAGLQSEKALGKGAGYLAEVYYQKLQSVILPVQLKMLEDFISVFVDIYDEWFGTDWANELGLDIKIKQVINSTSELLTTAKGVDAFLKIVKAVAAGEYPLEAAIKMVADRFGVSEDKAREQLGEIKVNVRTDKNRQKGSDKPE